MKDDTSRLHSKFQVLIAHYETKRSGNDEAELVMGEGGKLLP